MENGTENYRLTETEEWRFVRNGFLVVENAVNPGVLERARESFWESLPAAVERDDPTSWDESQYTDGLDERPEPADREAHEALLREVYPIAEALIGPELAPPDELPAEKVYHCKHHDVHVGYEHDGLMSPYPNYPGEDSHPEALIPHLDGGAPPEQYPDTYTPMNLVACVYLDDVTPGDGGTVVWPGSHEVVASLLNDDDGPRQFHEIQRSVDLPTEWELGPPMEVTGPAGTAFFVHPALVHSVGANLGDEIREMCLCRLATPDVEHNDIEPVTNLWGSFDGLSVDPATVTGQRPRPEVQS